MPDSIPRLLYVDDDAGSRAVMKAWLSSRQNLYAATLVSGIPDAAAHVSAGHYDLYILACSDAELEQAELCAAIRDANANVPVIIYGESDRVIDTRKAVAAGADLYINKPHDLDVLQAAVPFLLGDDWSRDGDKYETT